MNYILLPVGIACLAVAGLVFLKNHDILPQFVALDHWRTTLDIGFAGTIGNCSRSAADFTPDPTPKITKI